MRKRGETEEINRNYTRAGKTDGIRDLRMVRGKGEENEEENKNKENVKDKEDKNKAKEENWSR